MAESDFDMPTPLEAPDTIAKAAAAADMDSSVVVVNGSPTADVSTALTAPESPTPAVTAPSIPPRPNRSTKSSSLAGLDSFLAHLNRCMQTPSGVDTVLLLVCYSSRLSASIIDAALRPSPRTLAVVSKASSYSKPLRSSLSSVVSESLGLKAQVILMALLSRLTPKLEGLATRLRALSALATDARTFPRVWGMLGLYLQARKLLAEKNEEHQGFDRAIAWMQCVACIGLSVLENGAFLSAKKVLTWSTRQQELAGRWSSRCWASYVGLEIGRLMVERRRVISKRAQEVLNNRKSMQERGEGKGASSETVAVKRAEAKIREKEHLRWEGRWRGDVVRMLAWMPLTLHWSLQGGLVGEMAVGALACVPGVVQARRLWSETA